MEFCHVLAYTLAHQHASGWHCPERKTNLSAPVVGTFRTKTRHENWGHSTFDVMSFDSFDICPAKDHMGPQHPLDRSKRNMVVSPGVNSQGLVETDDFSSLFLLL